MIYSKQISKRINNDAIKKAKKKQETISKTLKKQNQEDKTMTDMTNTSLHPNQSSANTSSTPITPSAPTAPKKISIIVFSGDFDKAIAAYTLATGSAAVGYEVNLFFTFWGYNIIKKKRRRAAIGKGFLGKLFNWLMGGRKNLPLSRLNFFGISPKLMTYMMKSKNVATLDELIEAASALGIKSYACEMSQVIMGTSRDEYDFVTDTIGVSTFLEVSHGGQVIFI